MSKTKIAWSEYSWNPVCGCTKIAAGCKNCYAERMAARQVAMGYARHLKDPDSNEDAWIAYSGVIDSDTGKWNGAVELRYNQLEKPLHWRNPRRIFVCSMSDLFHEKVPFEFIDKVMAVLSLCPQHTGQILTKRPERMLDYFLSKRVARIMAAARNIAKGRGPKIMNEAGVIVWPLPNVHLGVSISTQEDADKNIPILLQIPAAVRFVSVEPMLEKVDVASWGWRNTIKGMHPRIHQVIVGGESGPASRPMHPDWPRGIRDQCVAAGVPFFFKQWGEWIPSDHFADCGWEKSRTSWLPRRMIFEHNMKFYGVGKKKAGRLLDGKEWNEYPK